MKTETSLCERFQYIAFTQKMYVESVKVKRQDFDNQTIYSVDNEELSSVHKIKDYLKKLDEELLTLLEDISENEVKDYIIVIHDKGEHELHVAEYISSLLEATLIEAGKIDIYLESLNIQNLPKRWKRWIRG